MAREKGLYPNVDFTRVYLLPVSRPTCTRRPRLQPRRLEAHVIEQYANNRLIRPRRVWTGFARTRLSTSANKPAPA